jgi:hypothetical protein
VNALGFCKLVEQRLGWCPPGNRQGLDFKRYGPTARRVKARMEEEPQRFTFKNLQLAVELLHRERLERSPLGVFAHVDRAVEMSRDVEIDLDEEIRKAMRIEELRGDPKGWATRFMRAQGSYRAEALAEWEAEQ